MTSATPLSHSFSLFVLFLSRFFLSCILATGYEATRRSLQVSCNFDERPARENARYFIPRRGCTMNRQSLLFHLPSCYTSVVSRSLSFLRASSCSEIATVFEKIG